MLIGSAASCGAVELCRQVRLFEAAPSPDCLAGLWRTFEATVQELVAKGLLQRLASGAE